MDPRHLDAKLDLAPRRVADFDTVADEFRHYTHQWKANLESFWISGITAATACYGSWSFCFPESIRLPTRQCSAIKVPVIIPSDFAMRLKAGVTWKEAALDGCQWESNAGGILEYKPSRIDHKELLCGTEFELWEVLEYTHTCLHKYFWISCLREANTK